MNPLMALSHSWEDEDLLQNHLGTQLLAGRMALVLGSGISQPFGLPGWEALLDGLYATAAVPRPQELTTNQQAELFLIEHCDRDKTRYRAIIKKVLYANLDISSWAANPALVGIGALAMSSARGNAGNIITFNFDDILEMYLESHGFVVDSVVESKFWDSNADVQVYHPHGLLAFRPEVTDSASIVLEQMAFSAALHGEPGRLWRSKMLGILRTNTCLFIGLSGADSNLESFLYECRNDHVAYRDELAYWGVRLTTSNSDAEDQIWAERGVATWRLADYNKALPSFLLAICRTAANLRRTFIGEI
jgi:hypothetical protein